MKNKFIISFTINILIGILFSFPVFSAQSIFHYDILYTNESSLLENEFGTKTITDQYFENGFYPENKLLEAPNITKRKSYTPGNSDNTGFSSILTGFRKCLTDYLSSDYKYLNPTFVNLTYLKDLRTTKMLC